MIEISINNLTLNSEPLVLMNKASIEVKGHSYFSDSGSDIVCAAVSILSFTALKSLSELAGIRQNVKQNSGYLKSEFKIKDLNDEERIKLRVIIDCFILGIKEIIKKYPDRVKLISD